MTDAPVSSLHEAAELLYAGPTADFGRLRTDLAARARAGGDRALARAILALRKPTLSAALVNSVVRAEVAELDELSALGDQLRSAHRQLRGGDLRTLSEQRQSLLQRLVGLAAKAAGVAGASQAVLDQVRETFEAAIADEDATRAVLSGQLTTALYYTGFGPVDLTNATATMRPRHLRPVPDRPAEEPDVAEPLAADDSGAEAPRHDAERRAAAERGAAAERKVSERRAVERAARKKELAAREKELAACQQRADEADAVVKRLEAELNAARSVASDAAAALVIALHAHENAVSNVAAQAD